MKNEIILLSESTQFLSLTQKYIKSYGIEVIKCVSSFDEIRELPKHYNNKIFIIQFKKDDKDQFLFEYLKSNRIKWICVSPCTKFNFEAAKRGALAQISISDQPTIVEYKNFLKALSKKISDVVEITKNEKSTKQVVRQDYKTVISIGASTGGTEAVEKILLNMEENIPPTLIVLHMPPVFTAMYAKRLNEICKMEVKEAKTGDFLRTGLVLIAAGGYQMKVKKEPVGYSVYCIKEGKFNGHEPSVDVLFNSVAEVLAPNVVSVILTGMGNDGASGILNIKNKGGYTIGQDKESSIVYGMPKAAFDMGAIIQQSHLDNIARIIKSKVKI